MERLLDLVAREMKLDRAEVRRRNLIPASKMPYKKPLKARSGAAMEYDSGDYPACQAEALAAAGWDEFPKRQAEARTRGQYLGIGLAHGVKGTGRGPFESGLVRISRTGKVTVFTGASAMGQGLGTAMAQIAAAQLGVSVDRVKVVAGDTSGVEPGLEANVMHRMDALSYANACHVAEVEVDAETGEVKILRYVAMQDSGVLINPMMVEGQIHGGVAHGIGNTFYEWMGYDDGAQPVTTTFADYLLPTATEVPMLQTLYKETRSPLNPLGVKGVGEAGTIPAAAALIAAVEDALTPFGVH